MKNNINTIVVFFLINILSCTYKTDFEIFYNQLDKNGRSIQLIIYTNINLNEKYYSKSPIASKSIFCSLESNGINKKTIETEEYRLSGFDTSNLMPIKIENGKFYYRFMLNAIKKDGNTKISNEKLISLLSKKKSIPCVLRIINNLTEISYSNQIQIPTEDLINNLK